MSLPGPALTTRSIGSKTEASALAYLSRQGLRLIQKNYLCHHGEIDLIMKDQHGIVFIEVRYRKNNNYGSGAETVDYRKQKKICKTALHFLQNNHKLARQDIRFDIVSLSNKNGNNSSNKHDQLDIDWIENAFQPAPEVWP